MANRRTLPKLSNHPGAKVEAKAQRLGLKQKVVAKFMGFDQSYLSILYRGYPAAHADELGNPPAEPKPLSAKMAEKVAAFLAKAADPELKKLSEKYPPRGLAAALAIPAPACQEPKPPKATKKAAKPKAEADAEVPVVVEGKPGKQFKIPPKPKATKKATKAATARKAAKKGTRQAIPEPQPVA
jgi:hypothetical protein